LPRKPTRPMVFLSFAGNDRPTAELLARDLAKRDIKTFLDPQDMAYGNNVRLPINDAMATSNYYVLLWSNNCVHRQQVEREWAAAYAVEVRKRRSFVFVIALDNTPLPPLMSVRRHLDGFHSGESVAPQLVSCWRNDLAMGIPTFPEPNSALEAGEQGVAVRIRNNASRMIYVVCARPDSTGDDLLNTVRTALVLPDDVSDLEGELKVRFTYTLRYKGEPVNSAPVAEQGITPETLFDLEMHMEGRGPDGPFGEKIYRTDESPDTSVSAEWIRAAQVNALAHLLP
jgi:hypothetical protein